MSFGAGKGQTQAAILVQPLTSSVIASIGAGLFTLRLSSPSVKWGQIVSDENNCNYPYNSCYRASAKQILVAAVT